MDFITWIPLENQRIGVNHPDAARARARFRLEEELGAGRSPEVGRNSSKDGINIREGGLHRSRSYGSLQDVNLEYSPALAFLTAFAFLLTVLG